MKKLTAYLLTLGMLILPRIEANVNNIYYKNLLETTRESKEEEPVRRLDTISLKKYVQNINPPKYNLKPEKCAQYLRLSAKKLFKKEYTAANSWNMMYHNKIIAQVQNSTDILKLINNENLKPGMAVGFHNPKSKCRNYKDEKGKLVKYTHIALYIGVNENYQPEFIHQDGRVIKKSTLAQMSKSKYTPKIVLDEKID